MKIQLTGEALQQFLTSVNYSGWGKQGAQAMKVFQVGAESVHLHMDGVAKGVTVAGYRGSWAVQSSPFKKRCETGYLLLLHYFEKDVKLEVGKDGAAPHKGLHTSIPLWEAEHMGQQVLGTTGSSKYFLAARSASLGLRIAIRLVQCPPNASDVVEVCFRGWAKTAKGFTAMKTIGLKEKGAGHYSMRMVLPKNLVAKTVGSVLVGMQVPWDAAKLCDWEYDT